MKEISNTRIYEIGLSELKDIINDHMKCINVDVEGVLSINPNMITSGDTMGTRPPQKFFDGLTITIQDKNEN